MEVSPSEQTGVVAERALLLAREAGRRLGVDVSGARVLRARSSVHIELPNAALVARVEAPGNEDLARRQVQVARILQPLEAPIAGLEQPHRQPIILDQGAVVLWHRIRSSGPPNPEALGRAVRQFHDRSGDPVTLNLPSIAPIQRSRESLEHPSPWSNTEAIPALERQLSRCEEEWETAIDLDPLGTRIVHGDVHVDNAMTTHQGAVLIDLEDAGVGPASWDFVPLAVGVSRYGLPTSDLRAFARGYGAESGNWPGFDLMCRVYELLVTTWAMQCSADSNRMAAEAKLRVASLLGQGRRNWTQV